jgi:exodeoxyribonuclease III
VQVTSLKVASWNVNSLRVRLPLILAFLEEQKPDVLALQETKVSDEQFPCTVFQTLGYDCLFKGQKTYNGVALLSRWPLRKIRHSLPNSDDLQCRLISAVIGAIKIINIYAPNGASLDSEKYPYKLQWFSELGDYLQAAMKTYPKLLVLGDFNIAPQDEDVYDPAVWTNQVLVSLPERTAFQALLDLGLQDSFRLFHSGPGHYTWWDYRQAAFRRNLGLRIDHILCSTALVESCSSSRIDSTWRQKATPSDHAPVIADFSVL